MNSPEMRGDPTIVVGIVTGDAQVRYWPIFFPVCSSSARSLLVSFYFLSGKWQDTC